MIRRQRSLFALVGAFVLVAGLSFANNFEGTVAAVLRCLVAVYVALGAVMTLWPGPALSFDGAVVTVGALAQRRPAPSRRVDLDEIESVAYAVPRSNSSFFRPRYLKWEPPGPRCIIIRLRRSGGNILSGASEADALPFVEAIQSRL